MGFLTYLLLSLVQLKDLKSVFLRWRRVKPFNLPHPCINPDDASGLVALGRGELAAWNFAAKNVELGEGANYT